MPKLAKKAIRLGRTDVRTDPNYRKASPFKTIDFYILQTYNLINVKLVYVLLLWLYDKVSNVFIEFHVNRH